MAGGSIGAILFDGEGLFGLHPDFLQNLIAEGMGTVLGIVISVAVAMYLDRRREQSRHVEHRGRAVTRWVKNHTDMIDGIVVEVSHGAGEVHQARAVTLVREAERDAGDIRADYAAALDRKAVALAFEEYIRALNTVASRLSGGSVPLAELAGLLEGATEALARLVRAAGARRSILQTEPVFAGMPKELRPHATA
jgi:hypothetical protein